MHGEEEAEKARTAARALFADGADDANMPTTALSEAQLTEDKIAIMDLMVACKLCATKSEARRLVQQGGVFVNGEKVPGIDFAVTKEMLQEGVKVRKGKKVFHKVILES